MKIRRILIGLLFLTLIPAAPVQADLNPGSLDTGFDPVAGTDDIVLATTLQPDGKVLIGGWFTEVDGVGRNRIARLNADGSLDTGFDSSAGANNNVEVVVPQPDGKLLIGGTFTQVNGVTRNRIARLNADGSLDTRFNPGTGTNAEVDTIALQNDGKVLIGGKFTQVNDVRCSRIARLNADGSLDTSFDTRTGANETVYAVALQPDGKVLIGGILTQVDGVGRNRIARLKADGSLDTSFDPGSGANNYVYSVALQTDGKVLIGGAFTQVDSVERRGIARLDTDGSLDTGFDPGTGANDPVYDVSLQDDGEVLIGGAFTHVDGVERRGIARLNTDGSLDTSFDTSSGANDGVLSTALQSDGKVLIGGHFTQVDGVGRNHIARLNADGSLDTGFDTSIGANNFVYSLSPGSDGKVIIGGEFTQVDGEYHYHFARLNVNGSLDVSFNPGDGANGTVVVVAVQPDRKVLIGGEFNKVNGMDRNHIARLNDNGTLDTTFDPGTGPNANVTTMALQPDGKVLIGGGFTQVDGVDRNHIARLNDDGSLDAGFDPGTGPNSLVYAVVLQPDGKVLIGGWFTEVNGVNRNYTARLNANGSLDTTFDTSIGADSVVYTAALQPDGKVLIGGNFTKVNNVPRSTIARLNANGSLDTTFDTSTGPNNIVRSLAIQTDGKVFIGGYFSLVGVVGRNYIARLNPDGSLDTEFDPGAGANNPVRTVAVQNDGKVLIGGDFTDVDNETRNHIARLNGATPPLFTSAPPAPSTFTYGDAYSHTFSASGFPVPTFHVPSWEIPPGLSLDSASGALTGVLTGTGIYNFTVTASNNVAPSDTQQVILAVHLVNHPLYLPLVER